MNGQTIKVECSRNSEGQRLFKIVETTNHVEDLPGEFVTRDYLKDWIDQGTRVVCVEEK